MTGLAASSGSADWPGAGSFEAIGTVNAGAVATLSLGAGSGFLELQADSAIEDRTSAAAKVRGIGTPG